MLYLAQGMKVESTRQKRHGESSIKKLDMLHVQLDMLHVQLGRIKR